MNQDHLLNNRHDALKAYIRLTYAEWKALEFVFRLSHISSENEMIDWMVVSTLTVLYELDDMTGDELACWLDEFIINEFQHKIRDGSIIAVAHNVFSHFQRFNRDKRKYLRSFKTTVATNTNVTVNTRTSTPVPMPVPNNSDSDLTDGEVDEGEGADENETAEIEDELPDIDAGDEFWGDL